MKKLVLALALGLAVTSVHSQSLTWLYARDDAYVAIWTLGYQTGVRAVLDMWVNGGSEAPRQFGLVLRAVANEGIEQLSGELRVLNPDLDPARWYISPMLERSLEIIRRY